MSTTYESVPSLLERVIGSDLIALGAVRGPVRVTVLEGSEGRRVHGWFEVSPQEVLLGETREILLRVIGEGSEGDATWPVPVKGDGRLLLMLTRDIGPDLPENLFAPCFNGIYELSDDGAARVPANFVEGAPSERVASEKDEQPVLLPIEKLRQVIETVQRRHEDAQRQGDDAEPAEVRQLRRLDVQEYPGTVEEIIGDTEGIPGGGQNADLE